jgi:hypothetical protein
LSAHARRDGNKGSVTLASAKGGQPKAKRIGTGTLAAVRGSAALVILIAMRPSVAVAESGENWELRGGLPASEIDLGFKVDV